MTTSTEPQTSTIHGLAHSIAALPYQLGYSPTASLVLICMGPAAAVRMGSGRVRGAVIMIARIDLGLPARPSTAVIGLDPALRRDDVASVAALVFEDGSEDNNDASSTLRALAAEAAAHSVTVVARARVRNGQFATVDDCGVTGPWLNVPEAGDVPAIADYVLAGHAPAQDRAALESMLIPSDADVAEAVTAHLRAGTRGDPREAARTLATVLTDPTCKPTQLDPRDIANLGSALGDLQVRDALLARLSPTLAHSGPPGNEAERQVALELALCNRVDGRACLRLASLAAYISGPAASPMLTLVGYLAWQAGEGALANIAIGAALDVDPDYSLARLVDMALSSALPPPASV